MFIAFLEREQGMAGVGSLAMAKEGRVEGGGPALAPRVF